MSTNKPADTGGLAWDCDHDGASTTPAWQEGPGPKRWDESPADPDPDPDPKDAA